MCGEIQCHVGGDDRSFLSCEEFLLDVALVLSRLQEIRYPTLEAISVVGAEWAGCDTKWAEENLRENVKKHHSHMKEMNRLVTLQYIAEQQG